MQAAAFVGARKVPVPTQASLVQLEALEADTLLAFCFADSRPLAGPLALVDWYMCGSVSQALARGHFTAATAERLLLPTRGRLGCRRLFINGLGETLACTPQLLEQQFAACMQAVAEAGTRRLALLLPAVAAGEPEALHVHLRLLREHLMTLPAHTTGPIIAYIFDGVAPG